MNEKSSKTKRFKIWEIALFFRLHRNTVTEYLKKYDEEFTLDLKDGQKALHCLYWLQENLPDGKKTQEPPDGSELQRNGETIQDELASN